VAVTWQLQPLSAAAAGTGCWYLQANHATRPWEPVNQLSSSAEYGYHCSRTLNQPYMALSVANASRVEWHSASEDEWVTADCLCSLHKTNVNPGLHLVCCALQDGGVQLVATTRDNVSPSFVLEFLKRIGAIIKVGVACSRG
jgi:hypothetical protein